MTRISNVIWKTSSFYPPLLREIKEAPKRLFYAGREPNPHDKYFAVVGTRHTTPYGRQIAEELTSALTADGFVIVSGLAYGIDAIAHETALKNEGRTIAVLGAGLDCITPPCNLQLAKRIAKTGTILTEYERGFGPFKGTFPERNRIIAGMCIGTLVVEAPEKSGALITARKALEFNREVFAVPGNITQETSRGCNQLIRDGKAYPVTCAQDIFDQLAIKKGYESAREYSRDLNNHHKHALTDEEEKIYKLLKKSPLSVDAIAAETGLPVPRVNVALSLLELKGLITISGPYALVTR